jgi:hypothetical protein
VIGHLVYSTPILILTPLALAVWAAFIVLGSRLAARARRRSAETSHAQLSTTVAAVLSLLALLLAFSFAMAQGRYDARRALVLEESNAIGTTYLRTELLDEPERSELKSLLRRYVDVRIALHEAGFDRRRRDALLAASVRLHAQLWDTATRAVARTPNQIASGLFLRSLNDVIDLHEKRRVAVENLVPLPIVELIFFVGCIAAALVGYDGGLDGARRFWPTFLATAVFVSVAALVLDLDRPARGLIRVPQESMIRLRHSLRSP